MNWESQIAERIEAHFGTYSPLRIVDPIIRNRKNLQKKWFKIRYDANPEYFLERSRKWKAEHKEACAKHQADYRRRHKDDPEYKAKKAAWNRAYRARKKEAA